MMLAYKRCQPIICLLFLEINQLNPLVFAQISAILLVHRIIPVFVRTQIGNCTSLTVRVGCAGRSVTDQSGFMKIVFHRGVIPQRTIAAGDRGLIHQKIGPHAVDGHRVLGYKHAGCVVAVKGGPAPRGSFPR